jgi:hypothetical protein
MPVDLTRAWLECLSSSEALRSGRQQARADASSQRLYYRAGPTPGTQKPPRRPSHPGAGASNEGATHLAASPSLADSLSVESWHPSKALYELTEAALNNGWAHRTRKNHDGAYNRYTRFCDDHRIPARLRFPAHEAVLCAFAGHRMGQSSGAAARNDLAGVKAMHTRHNAPWPESARLSYIVHGVDEGRPASSIRPERLAVSYGMVRSATTRLSPSVRSLDRAVRACAALAFWGQFRLGELLPTAATGWSPSTHPSRACWDGTSLRLPSTKTTRSKGASVSLHSQSSRTCPIKAMRRYVDEVKAGPGEPLFTYTRPSGDRVSLTKRAFLDRFNEVIALDGHDAVQGHAFRIGGTTELLRRGVAPDIVKMAGRWKSDSFLRYWRKLEEIAPLHLQDVAVSARHAAPSG